MKQRKNKNMSWKKCSTCGLRIYQHRQHLCQHGRHLCSSLLTIKNNYVDNIEETKSDGTEIFMTYIHKGNIYRGYLTRQEKYYTEE